MGQRLVEAEVEPHAVRVLVAERLQLVVVLAVALAEHDELATEFEEPRRGAHHQVDALLRHQPGDHPEHRRVRVLGQVAFALEVGLAGRLVLEHRLRRVVRRDVRVGGRVPLVVVAPVDDARRACRARPPGALQPAAELGRLDLAGVGRADGVDRVGEDDAGLQEVEMAVELQLVRG